VSFVPISLNYYDDLATRLVLDEAVIDRMRVLDVMFDRSPAGNYFHAFTEDFDGRFYFQIVQRIGNDGYGAVNAGARTASLEQTRQAQEWFEARL
jgi:4-hydroxyphenylpyruvate dioxygenase